MKPTQITELFANIKSTIVAFFSILMFVALAVAVFLGISWTSPALQNGAEDMFRTGQFHNFQVQFSYGLTDDDLEKLSAVEGVSQIEAERQSFQVIHKGANKYTVKTQSLGQEIDVPILIEGELPSKPNEMAFHSESAKTLGISVGDVITFAHDADGDTDLLLDAESDNKATDEKSADEKSDGSKEAADSGDASGSEEAANPDGADGSKEADSAASAESASGSSSAESADKSDGSSSADSSDKSGNSGKSNDASGMKFLTSDTFTVTAIVGSADYAARSSETYGFSNSASGMVDALAWVPDEAFKASAYHDGYPIVNIRCDDLSGLQTFDAGYTQKSDEIEERISTLGKGLAEARYDDLHGKAQDQVSKYEKQLNDGKKKISDGEKKIKDGEAELKQGRIELDEAIATGEAKLAEAYDLLMTGEAVKRDAEKKLSSAKSKLEEAQAGLDLVDELEGIGKDAIKDLKSYKAEQDKALAAGKISQKKHDSNLNKYGDQIEKEIAQLARHVGISIPNIEHTSYSDAIAAIQEAIDTVEDVPIEIEGKTMTIAEIRKQVEKRKGDLSSAQSKYDKKVNELSNGWNEYYAGQEALETKKAEGEQKLADGEAELKKGKEDLKKAKAEVAEKEPKLEEAKKQVEALKKYDWTVMPRAHNSGVVQVNTFGRITGNLSISMAALFIIVGLLVSYFAVSRIVHEQVTQIGTKKALGFRKGEITKSFLLYSGIAVLVGVIIGGVAAYFLVEAIISGALGGIFVFGPYPAYFGIPLFLAMGALELVLVLGATYLACRNVLKRQAVELLRGPKPPEGKTRFYEKWGIWGKLPLLIQTIVNNCANDKRRVLSTVVGVAGCTALIVTAITLNNDVLKSYDVHYDNVYKFNAIAYVDSEPEGADVKLEKAFQDEGATASRVLMRRSLMEQPNGESGVMRIIVPAENDAFTQLYKVNPTTGGALDLSAEGAWVSQAYADHLGAKVGDTVAIIGSDGARHEVPILGFYEFWLTYHEMVMGRDYYQKEFGDVQVNAVLAQTGDVSVADIEQSVGNVEGFSSIVDDESGQYGNFKLFSTVSSAVVAIYLALAALMAVVVLLNLNVMFIDEKKREIIVLMINGFSVKDAKHYISYDSIVLTAFGIIVGVILGCIMGSITVLSIEPSTGVFVKGIDGMAVGIGIVGSAILAFIMSKIALRRIPKFKLTDINRM